ncbi:hypothetical protein LKM00_26350 [Bacillus wiedmannii]|uniref:hypothetical protein n=1 Tax=Bacillus wiedmannii TaxID=1890302 RepID=UPI001E4CC13E|nr:hypothetical protein [Bacillus wiedmannii]MCC2380922.1 hypothetical protein [Bacillus wiedmannii]MCC2425385.1 hypothetical protein [Bacillus wiedmannii]
MAEVYKVKQAVDKLNKMIEVGNFSEEEKKKMKFSYDKLKRWSREQIINSNFDGKSYFIPETEFEKIHRINMLIHMDGKTLEQAKRELMVDGLIEKEKESEEQKRYQNFMDQVMNKYNEESFEPIKQNISNMNHDMNKQMEAMFQQICLLTDEVKDLKKIIGDQQLLLENQAPILLEDKTSTEDQSKTEEETQKQIAVAVNKETESFAKEMEELKKTVQQQQLLLEKQENEKTTENKKRKGFFSRIFSGDN